MTRACITSLVLPVVGLVLVLMLKSGEGFEPSTGFLYWFGAAAVFQAAGALVLFRPAPASWKLGWLFLWLSAVGYMGGYSSVYLQKNVVSGDLANAYVVMDGPRKLASIDAELQALTGADVAERRAAITARRARIAADIQTRTEALETKFPGRAVNTALTAELEPQEGGLAKLEYLFAVLFVAVFFAISSFATPVAQEVYRILDPDLEDPLAFKAEYGL